jgi:Tfp pilus assembly protein PilF
LKQYRHDFDGALADLDKAIVQAPSNAEALSLATTIYMVQGRYGEALGKCQSLQKIATELIGVGCASMLDALQGKARQAHAALHAAMERASGASPAQRLWAHTRLGEMAARFGDTALAEKHFRDGLSLGITDGYLLAAYADLLLDQGRPGDVLNLLKGMNRSDLLLLRIALAGKALGAPDAETYSTELSNRFSAAQMRGDKVHQAEEARFRLHIIDDARTALALAKENWTVQKETRDARILLEAAIAVKDAKSAEPVLVWLKDTNMEDVVLRRLAKQLEG